MSTCYLVIGTPRSGTSLIAGILEKLGIPMSLPDCGGEPNDWNQKGFFQCNLFETWGYYKFGPKNLNDPPIPKQLTNEDKKELSEIINKRSIQAKGDWGLKDPRLPLYLDSFLEIWNDKVKILRPYRDETRSIASWKSASEFATQEQSQTLIKYYSDILKTLNDFNLPTLLIDFDKIIDDSTIINTVAGFVDKSITESAINFPSKELRRF